MFPWPSYGGFLFRPEEHEIYATDAGWIRTPSYASNRALGTATNVITTLAIGSAERSFELFLTPERFNSLEMLLNSKALFTDWGRPSPDSRMAFLSEVTPLEDVTSYRPGGIAIRKRRTKVSLVSA